MLGTIVLTLNHQGHGSETVPIQYFFKARVVHGVIATAGLEREVFAGTFWGGGGGRQ